MAAGKEVRLRADAQRNRDQIIAAAQAAFAEHGLDLPMEDVARRARVGVGTLYRRFPDREALLRAVAQDNFAAVVDDARAALVEEPTAWRALVRLMSRSGSLRLSVQLAVLLPPAWATIKADPLTLQLRDDLMAALDQIVQRAQQEGSLRADIGTGDVAVMISLLLRRIPADSSATSETMLGRAVVLILDGLRAASSSPLPGRPMTTQDFTAQPFPESGRQPLARGDT
jgi:AcrR family transcriptional regulator